MKIKNTSSTQPVLLHLEGKDVRLMPRQTIEVPDKHEKNPQVQNLKASGDLKVTK